LKEKLYELLLFFWKGGEQMKLYEPFKIKNVNFKSRITCPPMVPFGIQEGEDYSLGEEVLAYYKERIHGKLGLLITQCCSVVSQDVGLRGFGIDKPKQREDLKKLIDISHANDTRIIVQLGYPSKGYHRHEKIEHWSKSELKEIESSFIECAKAVKELGADGVEIHGANMFFLNLFSSPISNKRTDEYGGDLKGRLHLAQNIINGIKEFADENFIIGYRLGWNQDIETDIATAKALEKMGVELLHISYGIREADRIMPKEYPPVICYPGSSREKIYSDKQFPYNDVVYTGAVIHENVQIPVILVDEIWTFARGEKLLQENKGEFIAFGRPLLADEDFIEQSEINPDFAGCYRCPECAWFSDYTKCPKIIKKGKSFKKIKRKSEVLK
jgi:2,4-dienoyl-CoA reductase-like NADH-dependent reductase (Old Yellow Enzyme family)